MSQAEVSKLIPKLKFNLKPRRKCRNPDGPQGRHDKIRKTVTALFKYERLELNYGIGDESRGYAERLISDAIKYGDCHKETMKMASYWIIEEQIVHKLFKVLAPRYQNFALSYTKMWKAPSNQLQPKCVLELRNNIYPPLGPDNSNNHNLIHNVLLREAKKAFDKEKKLMELKKQEKKIMQKLDEDQNIKENIKETETTLKCQETDNSIQNQESSETLKLDNLNIKDSNTNSDVTENTNNTQKN